MRVPNWLRPLAARLNRILTPHTVRRPQVRLRVEGLEDRSVPAVFTVTTTDDSGDGSLRQAIIDANTTAGADTINFTLPPSMKDTGHDWWRITPTTALPGITDTVTIDGWSQGGAGYNGPPLVMIDGSQLNLTDGLPSHDGVDVFADNCLIRGLAIGNFDPNDSVGARGILLEKQSNTVEGCYIGLDPSGDSLAGNCYGLYVISGTQNLIGGSDPGTGNVISGNLLSQVTFSVTDRVTLQNNIVGLNAAGTRAITNPLNDGNSAGVTVSVSYGTVIEGNTISGNVGDGIFLDQGTTGVQIRGNKIGTDVTGLTALGNDRNGIFIGSASNIVIGGTDPGSGNLISANHDEGIRDQSAGVVIQGNYIGTDANGAPVLGNDGGIVTGGSCTIGGSEAGAGNLIAGNSNINGGRAGLQLSGSNNLAQGNVIRDNFASGIDIYFGSQAQGNTITQNSIYNNVHGKLRVGMGIDIIDNPADHGGVTLNDSLGHDGTNHFQNFPVLASVSGTISSTTVDGTLTQAVTPNSTFRIEFFANTERGALGPDGFYYGEGKRYLGYEDVMTDGSGVAQINATGLSALNPGEKYITATATNLATGDTSEFSQAFSVPASVTPAFDSLAGPTITYGTPSVTLSGHIAAGDAIPPGNVDVTVNGVTQPAAIDSGTGNFATTFSTAMLPVAGSPYTITYSYPGATGFDAITDSTKTLTVTKATLTITTMGGSFAYDGQPHPDTGSVIGVNGENLGTPTFNYSFTDDNGNVVTQSGRPVEPGYYTVTASFAGNDNYEAASKTVLVTIYYDAHTLTDLSKAFHAGRTIPIKLQLTDASGNNISSPNIDVTATRLDLVTGSGTTQVALQNSGNANPNDQFRYDSSLQGYIFNLSTKDLGAGEYDFSWMAGDDPTTHVLNFQLV